MKITVEIIAKTPIIAPYSDDGIIETYKHFTDNPEDVDRVFLRDEKGRAFVMGSMLRGMINKMYRIKKENERCADVLISEGRIYGKITVFTQIRKSSTFCPEVLLPGGKIVFEVKGSKEEIDKFKKQLEEAHKLGVRMGAGGSRGFGKFEYNVISYNYLKDLPE